MSDLVGKPKDRFSHNEAQIISISDDDPMVEHARWYPRCEYINKLKGTHFVQAVLRRHREHVRIYRKVPKFWDTINLCCNLPKIQAKRPNFRLFCQNGAQGIANSEEPDQTAPLGAV